MNLSIFQDAARSKLAEVKSMLTSKQDRVNSGNKLKRTAFRQG